MPKLEEITIEVNWGGSIKIKDKTYTGMPSTSFIRLLAFELGTHYPTIPNDKPLKLTIKVAEK